jgi:hypothetical protein
MTTDEDAPTSELAINRIARKVRSLISPTAMDFFQLNAERLRGVRHRSCELQNRLGLIEQSGKAAATRLNALTRDGTYQAPPRSVADVCARKYTETGK